MYNLWILLLLCCVSLQLDLSVEYSHSSCQLPSNGECDYTKNDLKSDWKPLKGGLEPWYMQLSSHTYVTANPRSDNVNNGSRSLRIRYPATALVSESGNGWKVGLTPSESYWSAYTVYFPDGTEGLMDKANNEKITCYNFQCGGKLPGQCGGPCSGYPNSCTKDEWEHQGCNTGGHQPTPCSKGGGGQQGWSARTMWREYGIAVTYMYSPGAQASDGYGYDIVWQHPDSPHKCVKSTSEQPVSHFNQSALTSLGRGVWQQITEKVTMNTIGNDQMANNDGGLQVWLDGELVVNCTDLVWRCTSNIYVNKFYFSTFFGGKEKFFEPGSDQHAWFDDFYTSITPMPNEIVHLPKSEWEKRHHFPAPQCEPGLKSVECNRTKPGPPGPGPQPGPPPGPAPGPPGPAPPPAPGKCQECYQQCGGKKWHGPTTCCPTSKCTECVKKDDYYSSCRSPSSVHKV